MSSGGTLFLETVSVTDPGAPISMLASWQVPAIFPSLPCQGWDYRCVPPCLAFTRVPGDRTQSFMLVHSPLPTEPSPGPLFLFPNQATLQYCGRDQRACQPYWVTPYVTDRMTWKTGVQPQLLCFQLRDPVSHWLLQLRRVFFRLTGFPI